MIASVLHLWWWKPFMVNDMVSKLRIDPYFIPRSVQKEPLGYQASWLCKARRNL